MDLREPHVSTQSFKGPGILPNIASCENKPMTYRYVLCSLVQFLRNWNLEQIFNQRRRRRRRIVKMYWCTALLTDSLQDFRTLGLWAFVII
jgi:hypothetical protein